MLARLQRIFRTLFICSAMILLTVFSAHAVKIGPPCRLRAV